MHKNKIGIIGPWSCNCNTLLFATWKIVWF